jgi:hypothetical protein
MNIRAACGSDRRLEPSVGSFKTPGVQAGTVAEGAALI